MNILAIGGSDPSSGAGIQSDVRTAQLLDAYCLTVVTAVTSQNTKAYSATSPVSPGAVLSQLESVTSDFEIDAVKVGMVYDSETIRVLDKVLDGMTAPVVVDPVIRSTTGGTLLRDRALGAYRECIVGTAHVITPNVHEAEVLADMRIAGEADVEGAASKILDMGAKNVVITGIDDGGDVVSDYVRTRSDVQKISSPRITAESHGGGCTFSMALAVSLARGDEVSGAARFAGEFTRKSLVGARRIGGGVRIAGLEFKDGIRDGLAGGIARFVGMDNACNAIPECQTNFVYSRQDPKGVDDVAGLEGRIVRAGEGALVAGRIRFGGSRHVASAVLAANKRFPGIRSAINIRYEAATLDRLEAKGLRILKYDRGLEPPDTKRQEGASVYWGISSAISGSDSAPDVIFHEGDVGKEPMVLVFGENPQAVLDKIVGVF